jgi:pimeloyl-ACP methyl ester carboxylesterase
MTALLLAMTAKHRVTRVFAFGANTTLAGLKKGGATSKVFSEYISRCEVEYKHLAPDPDRWRQLNDGLRSMWRREPHFRANELHSIAVPTTISDGVYDEIIAPEHVKKIAESIPGAKLRMQRDVSHFAMLQDSSQFNYLLMEFLAAN